MNITGKSERICINCKKLHETEKAWLVDDGKIAVWMPKSQCELDERADGTWDLFAEEWLLKTKNLL